MVVRFRLFITLALILTTLSIQAAPEIEQWTTSNGAKVLYVHAPDLPMVDVRVVFDAGSARDGDLPGLASMTSGLLIEGAGEWTAEQISERIESVGAKLSTESLRDMSLVTMRSLTEQNALDTALETLTKVIVEPTFDQSALDRDLAAMKIILRQEKQSPSSIANKAFFKAMYGDHPYGHSSNGNEESLAKITKEVIKQFHQQYFVGKNASLVIVGAVDKDAAITMSEAIIGKLPSGEPAAELPVVTSKKLNQRVEIEFPSSQSHLFIGMPVLTRDDPDYFALYVGNHILGGSGLVSELAKEVREKRGLAYSAYSYFSPMRGPGPFMMGLQTKGSQVKEAEEVVRQTLQTFLDNGPDEKSLSDSKKNITGGFPLKISSNKKIIEHLAMLGFYDMPLDYLETYVDRVNAVTAEQIRETFNRRLKVEQFSTIVVGPK